MSATLLVRVCAGTETGPASASHADVRLDVLGRPLRVRLHASAGRMRLPDLVPAAFSLSSALTDAALAQLAAGGQRPHCGKGCSACCRFLVPVSAVEALWMWERTAALPGPRRARLLKAYLEGAQRVLKAGPPSLAAGGADRIEEVARWYAGLGLDCPFLVGGACAAYARRPLACREFFAYCHTTPASARGAPARTRAAGAPVAVGEPVRLPISLASALSELAGEFEPDWPKAIVLPLALAWAADSAGRRPPRRWPAATLAGHLAGILQRQAARHEQETQAA